MKYGSERDVFETCPYDVIDFGLMLMVFEEREDATIYKTSFYQ